MSDCTGHWIAGLLGFGHEAHLLSEEVLSSRVRGLCAEAARVFCCIGTHDRPGLWGGRRRLL